MRPDIIALEVEKLFAAEALERKATGGKRGGTISRRGRNRGVPISAHPYSSDNHAVSHARKKAAEGGKRGGTLAGRGRNRGLLISADPYKPNNHAGQPWVTPARTCYTDPEGRKHYSDVVTWASPERRRAWSEAALTTVWPHLQVPPAREEADRGYCPF